MYELSSLCFGVASVFVWFVVFFYFFFNISFLWCLVGLVWFGFLFSFFSLPALKEKSVTHLSLVPLGPLQVVWEKEFIRLFLHIIDLEG